MAAEWKGKSRGSVFGYKIFVFCIKKLGIRSAYFILYFVAAYFCVFARSSTKASYYYFRKRRKHTALKSSLKVYQSYYKFGQTLIDRIAISSGLRDKFTYNFDGIEQLQKLLKQQQGGILISAHVGNFKIAEHFLNELDENPAINLLATDFEHKEIKEYLEGVTVKSNTKFIIIKEDLSHIFEMNAALSKNELICITGDRYIPGVKYLTAPLLGKEAKFPAGPFLIASRLQVPVVFVYLMKETNKHYHLYARTTEVKHRDAQGLLTKYIENVEWILDKYPLQWFNYFDFWDDLN